MTILTRVSQIVFTIFSTEESEEVGKVGLLAIEVWTRTRGVGRDGWVSRHLCHVSSREEFDPISNLVDSLNKSTDNAAPIRSFSETRAHCRWSHGVIIRWRILLAKGSLGCFGCWVEKALLLRESCGPRKLINNADGPPPS